jgi:hypothetical protein
MPAAFNPTIEVDSFVVTGPYPSTRRIPCY